MRILYLQYTNPAAYPPLQHSSRILANDGWKVLFLGTGSHGADALEFPPHPNVRVKRLPFCPAGWRQKLQYVQFAFWVFLWLLLWRPQWIYVSDPLACPIALLLSFVPGLKMLYHEHDSPNLNWKHHASRFESFVLRTRCKVAERASLCVLPNERRAQRFKRETDAHRSVLRVWNCPALEEVSQNGLDDARILVSHYLDHYNTVRLHSATGYIAPKIIWKDDRRKSLQTRSQIRKACRLRQERGRQAFESWSRQLPIRQDKVTFEKFWRPR